MISPLTLIVGFLLAANPDPGDPRAHADRLVEEGAKLGREGAWDLAIERFEAADRIFPRAIHACNIGLAHARANRPEHALLKLTTCQARATEPLPSWVGKRVDEARETLIRGNYAALELVATSPGTAVTIAHYGTTVFTPPVTLWLPLGTHAIHAEAPGRVPYDAALVLDAKGSRREVLELAPVPVVVPEPDPPKLPDPEPEPITTTRSLSRAPAWITLISGGVVAAVGGIFYGVAVDTHDEAEGLDAGDPRFEDLRSQFQTERAVAYTGLALGGAAIATGILLLAVMPTEEVVVVPAPNGVSAAFRF